MFQKTKTMNYRNTVNNDIVPKFKGNFQLLKFILSIFVVFYHVFLNFKFLTPLLGIPVNTFAILTGYILIFKNNKFRAINFIFNILFLWLINIFLYLFFSCLFGYFNKLNWLSILLTGNNWAWWYLSAITIIYIFSPILNYIILNTKKSILLKIIFIIWLTFQVIIYFLNSKFLWIIPLFYCYFIGGSIKLYFENYSRKYKLLTYIIVILLFCLMIILNIFYLTIFTNNHILSFFIISGNNSPGTVFLAIGFFLVFLTFNIKNYKWIFLLGNLSFFIFAYHMFFYINFHNITGLNYNCNFNVIIFFVLFSTFLLSLLLYIPFKKYQQFIESKINIFSSYKWSKINILLINTFLLIIMLGFYISYFII